MGLRVLLTGGKYYRSLIETPIFVRRYTNENSDKINCAAVTSYQPVAEFYKGKSIFLTGGLGFLGKVLTEKLLYSTELDKIYLLIREKKGIDVNIRLENMLENPLFSRLKESKPDFLDKIVPIKGDVTLPNLGINQADQEILKDKISILFHTAASINLQDPLSMVMHTNYKGTQNLLDFCKRFNNFESEKALRISLIIVRMIREYVGLAHAIGMGIPTLKTDCDVLLPGYYGAPEDLNASLFADKLFMESKHRTNLAYINPQRSVLLEKLYPSPAEVKDVYKFIEKYGNDQKETMKFIDGFIYPYCFSKAMTENYVADNHGDIPTAIVRPSLITPTISEPMKGWTDNWNTTTTPLHIHGKGWNIVTYGKSNNISDIIPVDYVSNFVIIAAARLQSSKKTPVYNITSSSINPIFWSQCLHLFREEYLKQGQSEVPRMFHVNTMSHNVVKVLTIMLQQLPAQLADFWLTLRGKEAKYVKILSEIIAIRNFYSIFTSNSWVLRSDNARKLYSKLSPEDQKIFPCDPADIIWSKYIKDYCKGIFKYLKPKYTARND